MSGPATGVAGSNVAYTLTATNGGPDPATSVAVANPYPAQLIFVSAVQNTGPAFSCSNTTPNVVCSGGTLANGASAQFTFTFQIAPNTASGTFLTNTAATTSAVADPNLANNAAASSLTVSTSADVAITKSAPATVNAGANLAYTITVTNAGPSDAAGVSWTDTLPAGTTFVSLNQTSGTTFSCTTGGTETCTLATMPPGSAAFTLTAGVGAGTASGTVFSNTATVSATTSDPAAGNNSATANTTVATSADLSVTKSGPATATVGGNISYTITVNNAGPSAAAGATVSDTIPANTSLVSATPSQGSCSGTTTVTCGLGAIANGGSATITLTVRFNSGTSVSNTATVSATTADPTPGNNSSTSAASIPVTAVPTLSGWALAGLTGLLAAAAALSIRSSQKARGV